MSAARVHRAVSADGTEIAARVLGEGPPLVLLPAGPGDSEASWRGVVPYLADRFTCHLMDTRGRGLSADHPDHSPARRVEDVIAVADSLGEPVGLVGWGDALWALVAARDEASVSAVAAYEPGVDEVMSEEEGDRLVEALTLMGELVAAGRPVEAARAFVERSGVVYCGDELAAGAPSAFWAEAAPNLGVFLLEMEQTAGSGAPGPTSPSVLAAITAPVLLLHGSESQPWFHESVRHVARHVADPHVREIPGAGHFGPVATPHAVAAELARFFTGASDPT